jgi:transcriptional regulator with XRE-family HTH domain
MARVSERAYSRHGRDAATLLGQLIRRRRIERRLTVAQLAERAGLSRGLVQRIERGDPGCSIGAAFEAATIAGVQLFGLDPPTMTNTLRSNAETLALLPKSVQAGRRKVKDDF